MVFFDEQLLDLSVGFSFSEWHRDIEICILLNASEQILRVMGTFPDAQFCDVCDKDGNTILAHKRTVGLN